MWACDALRRLKSKSRDRGPGLSLTTLKPYHWYNCCGFYFTNVGPRARASKGGWWPDQPVRGPPPFTVSLDPSWGSGGGPGGAAVAARRAPAALVHITSHTSPTVGGWRRCGGRHRCGPSDSGGACNHLVVAETVTWPNVAPPQRPHGAERGTGRSAEGGMRAEGGPTDPK